MTSNSNHPYSCPLIDNNVFSTDKPMFSWLFKSEPKKASRKQSFKPSLECLEDRSVPAVISGSITSATFLNAQPGSATVTYAPGKFTWGDMVPSALTFNNSAFSPAAGKDVGTSASFSLGTLIYFNGQGHLGTGADSVDLQLTIDLGLVAAPQSFTLHFGLINTLNTGTPQQNADQVAFKDSFPIYIGLTTRTGGTLTLQILGFGAFQSGGFGAQKVFNVLEGDIASATLVGKFVSVPDLRVSSVKAQDLTNVSPQLSGAWFVSFVVDNIGGGNPGAFYVSLYLTNGINGKQVLSTIRIDDISAPTSFYFPEVYPHTHLPSFEIVVDPNTRIPDYNRQNNSSNSLASALAGLDELKQFIHPDRYLP